MATATATGDAIAGWFPGNAMAQITREGLIIVGWVAMWRPLEVFLYNWWPIRAEARLFERLSAMPVRIEYEDKASRDAWQSDWPAATAPARTARALPDGGPARDSQR